MARQQGQGILGRLAAALKRRRRAAVPAPAAPSAAALLEGMGWHRFELLAAEGFRQRGYVVTETGGAGTRAVDMVLQRGAERFLVDCKPWRAKAVGVAPLRELHALIVARGAAGGFVITSGEFTDEARRFSARRSIELIEGRALAELLSTRQEKTQPLVRRDTRFLDTTLPPSAWKARHQPCPLCGARMVERVVPPGRRVLGCSHFPLCEGTREF
jgi:restriction system protein